MIIANQMSMSIASMLTGIDFMKPLPDIEAPPPKTVPSEFFVHFNRDTLDIRSVSTKATPDEGQLAVKVKEDLGKQLLIGTENVLTYQVVLWNTGGYELVRKTEVKIVSNRLEVASQIYEVKDGDYAQIVIMLCSDHVLIQYNGEWIQTIQHPIKLYFTREDDLSFLKCAFSLDVNILNKMLVDQQLDSWPNPIRLDMDTNDLSIYGVRDQATVVKKIIPNEA